MTAVVELFITWHAICSVASVMRTQEHEINAATSDLHTLLGRDHHRLNESFGKLVAAFRQGDRTEAAALWDAFDKELEAHMALEEQYILPEFAKVDPSAAAAIAREHAALRAALSELGLGVDLHCTKADAVERFVAALKEHAEREDALMYRWAQANLGEHIQVSIGAQLRGAVQKLIGAA